MSIPYGRYIVGRLPWYGVLIALGASIAFLLACREEKRHHLQEDTILDLAFFVIPAGIIGARIYYVVFNWQAFAERPWSTLYIWEGGLAIYGGVIGGLIAILFFARRRKLNPFLLTDMIVPGLALAQCIGRWGNYFNMEAYGLELTNPALHFFPVGVQIPTGNGYTWHMATFFYESCWNLLVFLLLWFVIRKKTKTAGATTLWYLLFYSVGRFLIEEFRTDSLMLGSLRVSQLLSLLLIVFSTVALMFIRFHAKQPYHKGGRSCLRRQ